MTYKKLLVTIFAIIGGVLLAQPNRASAAQALPPALQAAVQSGNAAAIKQAINTLSRNNPVQAAALAAQVATAAEGMLATNPQAAVSAVSAAVEIVKNVSVMSSAPMQAVDVATIASRIIGNADAQRVAPQTVANIAGSVAAIATNSTVYNGTPDVALQLMKNAYAAASSAAVSAAVPGAKQEVATTLADLAISLSSNPAGQAKIYAILGGQSSSNPQNPTLQPGTGNNNTTNKQNQLTPPLDAGALPVTNS